MTRNKLAQHAKNQDRSTIFKTKLKSTTATFLAPQQYKTFQVHGGLAKLQFDALQMLSIILPHVRNSQIRKGILDTQRSVKPEFYCRRISKFNFAACAGARVPGRG